MKTKIDMMVGTVKMAWALDRKLIVLTVVSSVIFAVRPYVLIFLGAYVLDGFISGVAATEMALVAAVCFAALFVIDAGWGAIDKVREVRIDTCVLNFNIKRAKRTLEMDYELLESPSVNALRTRMNTDRQWGAGFHSVFWQLSPLISGSINLIVSAVILIPLFFAGTTAHFFASLAFVGGAAAVAVISGAVSGRLGDKETAVMDELQSSEAKKYAQFDNLYWGGGIDYKKGKDARIYNIVPLMQNYINRANEFSNDWRNKITKIWAAKAFTSSFSGGLIWAGALLFVTVQAIAGAITIGAVLLYANALNNFAKGFTDMANIFNMFAVTSKRQQAILEYMSYPDVLHKGTLPVEKRRDNEFEIEFRDVSFKYPGGDNYALRNFNLKLQIGRKLAVVGMNGSGKTTMIKLLCRLYDPTEGVITLNGYDIRKYNYAEYINIFSVVFQDFKLFSFPLGQNISAGKEYDAQKANRCLDAAGLAERKEKFAKGLDTPLYSDYEEGGVEVSGGEAQKIALARALYKDAPFVVLDEPTAALDPIAEFEIYSRFNEIAEDKTTVYISHRLSSCRFCDDIAVFHEGRLVQRGNHDSLISDESGKYNELWNAQAQYYSEA